jgi:hypothetical protein
MWILDPRPAWLRPTTAWPWGLRPTTMGLWVLKRERERERGRERNIPVSKRVAGGEMERVIRDCVISSHI